MVKAGKSASTSLPHVEKRGNLRGPALYHLREIEHIVAQEHPLRVFGNDVSDAIGQFGTVRAP